MSNMTILFDKETLRAWMRDAKGNICELADIRFPIETSVAFEFSTHRRESIRFSFALGTIETENVAYVSAASVERMRIAA